MHCNILYYSSIIEQKFRVSEVYWKLFLIQAGA